MGKRQTTTIPFGAGLDRLSGAAVVDSGSFADLRNVHLARGRMELRRGLASQALPWGTDCIAVAPVKKTGLAAIVIYDSVSKDVRLYSFDGATTFSLVGTLWTINAAVTSHVPRVSIAEVYSQVFIAHEEPLFQYRGATKVYDVTASTLADFKLNLDRKTPAAVKFRGVAKHLSYLIGWGYGTATNPDCPETLRISAPGDPTSFSPEHYFLIGSPSDPIIAGTPLVRDNPNAGGFAIGKDAEWWRLAGYDRTTFGIVPLEPDFGLITSRMHVDVEGELFFWSLHGPRSTTGGPSVDLTPPLDLPGPLPDASAATNDRGFAWYDPTEGEVIFCFGTFAYVLHLKDTPRRWSYRQFGVELNSAGFLFPATGTGKLNLISALIGVVTATAPTYLPGDDNPTFTIPWTLSGAGAGNESVEVWARHAAIGLVVSPDDGSWKNLGTFAATALTGTVTVPYYLTSFDLAIRVVAAGTPGAGFTATDPDTWPATARATKISAGAITTFITSGLWERRSPINHGKPFTYVGPGASLVGHPELAFKYEQSIDAGGSWHQHAAGTYQSTPLVGSQHGNADRPTPVSITTVRYRLTVIGPSATLGPTSGTSDVVLAPGAPTISTIGVNTGDLQFGLDLHSVVVDVGTHGGPVEVRGRHDPDGTWSPTYTVPGGNVEVVIRLDNTGGADDVRIEAVTHIQQGFHTPGGTSDPGDYSETTVLTGP